MLQGTARILLSAVCLLPAAAVSADLIPVRDFARHAEMSMPRLSPNGQHIAVNVNYPDGVSHALVVYNVEDMAHPVNMLRLPKYVVAADITWVSDNRLVLEKGQQFGSIEKPSLTGEVIGTDIDGKHQDYIYGSKGVATRRGARSRDQGWAFVSGVPTPANGHVYLSTQEWGSNNRSTLYDVDTRNSARHLMGQINVGGLRFMVGADGKAHFAYGTNEDYDYVVYRQLSGSWVKLSGEHTGGSFQPIHFTPDLKGVYARQAPGGGALALIQQDEDGSNRKELAAADFAGVDMIEWTALPQQPFATTLAAGRPVARYIEQESATAKLHKALSQKFADSYVSFLDFSEDGRKLMFSTSSDRDPGSYYLIDTQTFKADKLFDREPWIDPARMAERRPVRFKASDGLELEAILTLPRGVAETNLPMVLLPHGGPIGVRDDWFYDSDAQFLASRGYLVLQVNYRGSGGRGSDFMDAANLQWGTRVQQDLIDGVKWAITEKFADPQRVCVYGASFGGYSALMSSIRAPDMFKCAVGYAGIYDLAMMYKKGDIKDDKSGRSYLTTVIGKDDADLAANSPAKLADKINVPVLLVHGEEDQRAPFVQAKAMRAALDAAHKPYEWLSKPEEGHGFYSEENTTEFYELLQAFLAKHIGPGSTPP